MDNVISFAGLPGEPYLRESINVHEGVFLGSLVASIQAKVIVEIGSWIGVSTAYLAKAVVRQESGRVYAIDPHFGTIMHKHSNLVSTEQVLREDLQGLGFDKVVEVIVKTSMQALEEWRNPEKVDLLFVDGAHYFAAVRQDFGGWSPWVRQGGIIAFHDYGDRRGVTRVVNEILVPSGLYEKIGQVKRVIAFRKR